MHLQKYCSAHNVAVSIGHSGATFQEGIIAVANGAKSITHTYNGQSPFNHRANGVTGLALRLVICIAKLSVTVTTQHPEALNIFLTQKGRPCNHDL